ncbi:polymer-forming cytoskeletal protein [Ferrovibrio sp.]|uniref:bactofilin family protein n=1 Tax=Ferrovibrio sp. TaxID=1917215 RepID=UPI0025C5D899|nr:polymer-forming cytoskeletal protein [Ferrovibrio sp.]MBX3456183.1 polymer-forming cytoskeletal protein [Ferrovibrio sp.]
MFSNSKKTPPPSANKAPPSLLSAGLTVNGDLHSEGEVQIDCQVNGDVTAMRLAIGENARVVGEVVADHVLIRGEVTGRIRAKSVELDKTARVRGDIWHELLSIAAGAKIEGLCKFAENPREAAAKFSVVTAITNNGAATNGSSANGSSEAKADKAESKLAKSDHKAEALRATS